ncbi:MAG: hypothetical protein QM767_00030 [Anaeromyxobacter sp.]
MPAPAHHLLRRAATSSGALALWLYLQHLPLPFLAPDAPNPRLLALGLRPLVTAFLVVEALSLLLALAPRFRGPRQRRAGLLTAAWLLGTALAALQAWQLIGVLTALSAPLGRPLLLGGAFGPTAAALSLVAGTLLCGALAELVTRRGLGNGFALLLSTQVAQELLTLAGLVRDTRDLWGTGAKLVALLALLAGAALVARLLRTRPGDGPRIPAPTCSMAVVALPPLLLGLLTGAGERWTALAPLAEALPQRERPALALQAALAVLLALALAPLFTGRRAVVEAHRRAAAVAPPEAIRAALLRAHARSLLAVTLAALLPLVMLLLGLPILVSADVALGLAMIAALVADLAGEVRARRTGASVAAGAIHRVHAVPPIVAELAAQGIAARPRTMRFRALFHAFAPFAPVQLLVAPEHAQAAEAICARLVQPEPAQLK